jgi:hypothetical protein
MNVADDTPAATGTPRSSTSRAGLAATWDTNPESWIAFACAIAGRNLTPEEWANAFGTGPYHHTCPPTG